jgi:hypothetical protein
MYCKIQEHTSRSKSGCDSVGGIVTKGLRSSPLQGGVFVSKFVNIALQMPEPELIEHAGLDSAVYLRIYLLGNVMLHFDFYKVCSSQLVIRKLRVDFNK